MIANQTFLADYLLIIHHECVQTGRGFEPLAGDHLASDENLENQELRRHQREIAVPVRSRLHY